MTELLTAVRWNWFTLARRWMPWILLVILLLLTQLRVWGTFFAYQTLQRSEGTIVTAVGQGRPPAGIRCKDVLAGGPQALPAGTPPEVAQGMQAQCRQQQALVQRQLASEYDNLTLPGSIPTALSFGLSVSLILLSILTASHLGAEYGWGTVRPNLIRGIGRPQYLTARLILLSLAAAGALLAVVGATAVSSFAAQHLAQAPAQLAGAASWTAAGQALFKSWVALIPYVALGAVATALTRSTAAAMAIAIGYYLGEQVVVAILGNLFDWFRTAAGYLLGQNIDALAGASFLGAGQTSVSGTHALLVLAAYTVLLGGAAFYLFKVRDVGGSSAG